MKNNLQAGFLPFIVIAVVAALAVGGGVYYATRGDEAGTESEVETEAKAKVETHGDVQIKGESSKSSLRSLLAIGKDVVCTFESSARNTESSGTVYISSTGEMHGNFDSENQIGSVHSHMIVKADGMAYVWSGSQGTKMNFSKIDAAASSETDTSVNMDAQVEYKCSDWKRDNSKFEVPSDVNFIDIDAMMKGTLPGNIDIQGVMKGDVR